MWRKMNELIVRYRSSYGAGRNPKSSLCTLDFTCMAEHVDKILHGGYEFREKGERPRGRGRTSKILARANKNDASPRAPSILLAPEMPNRRKRPTLLEVLIFNTSKSNERAHSDSASFSSL